MKTAVSEAVTNCIIHGYQGEVHKIRMKCVQKRREQFYLILEDDRHRDCSCGKSNGALIYTTRADQEQVRMGFTFMEALYGLRLKSPPQVGKGTCCCL